MPENEVLADLRAHLESDSPLRPETLELITIGRDKVFEFFEQTYLRGFIKQGGAKVKFLVGAPGAGKSHALQEVARVAAANGYVVSRGDGRQDRLDEFQALYQLTLRGFDIEGVIDSIIASICVECGWDPVKTPGTLVDDWHAKGVKQMYMSQLRGKLEAVFKDRAFNRAFATALSLLLSHKSGMSKLDETQLRTILGWLRGEPILKSEVKHFEIHSKIDRYSSRDMLRSWVHLLTKYVGKAGLVVVLDNVDALINGTNPETGRPLYTKQGRDKAYENIRQMIDDVDQARHLLLVLGGSVDLIDDKKRGLRTYAALWQRLQDELQSKRFNRFADLILLDKTVYDEPEMYALAEKVNAMLSEQNGNGSIPANVLGKKVQAALAGAGKYAPPAALLRSLLGVK